MKTHRKFIIVLAIAGVAIAALMVVERSPRTEARVFDPTFDHRTKEAAKIAIPTFASGQDDSAEVLPVPKFKGYFGVGSDKRFALALPSSDGSPESLAWVGIGQKIGEFEITAFDSRRETLELKGSRGKEVEIRLVEGKVTIDGASEARLQQTLGQLMDPSLRSIRDIRDIPSYR